MKLWPARTQAKQVEPVCDLDAILAEPVAFRWNGTIHYLKPMQLDEFLKYSNAQSKLMAEVSSETKLDPNTLIQRYHAVISSVCDTISVEDIKSMSQAQVAALYQLVIDLVTGQVVVPGDSKKKRLKLPLYESVEVSSSPNVV